ncbi:MAG: hypothetical protein NZ899_12400 [Thermoguttaceae bacterium]|nr:hypothetical protein [Thermoguttaceae bacterium]MDW8078461.1 hypothetical protein [Thermoguttaceae bacterium]
MQSWWSWVCFASLSTLGTVAFLPATLAGAAPLEFRVENSVYVDQSSRPISESITLFVNDKFYDFLRQPEEIVIFNPTLRHFTLLYPPAQLRTELRVEQVAAFITTLRSWALKHEDSFLRFLASPEITVQDHPGAAAISFDSEYLSYLVDVDRPPSPQIAQIYAEFSDWYSQLNTMVTPGSRLPFARLQVNKVLLERGLVPLRVELKLKPAAQKRNQPAVIRSYHNFFYRVSESDRSRANQADQFVQLFRQVSFIEYQEKLRATTK